MAFAVQSMVAEIAAALGRDPKEMLLELIGPDRIVDPSKSPGVTGFWNYGDPFETYPIRDRPAAPRGGDSRPKHAGWGKPLPKGQGLGIAAHRSFLSYVATVVHVAVDDKGNLSVPQRGYRHRLRRPHQPGAHPLADRRRGGDGSRA